MNCPYCGKYDRYAYTVHARTCRYNPDIVEMLKDILPSANNPRRICTETEYMAARRDKYPDAPSRETIRKQYGCWEDVAKEFGLEVADHNDIRTEEKLAATKAALEKLSHTLYGGEYAPTQNDYRKYAVGAGRPNGPMTCDVLSHRYGGWADVLRQFGMEIRTKPLTQRKKVEQEYSTIQWWYTTDNRVVNHKKQEIWCVLVKRYRSKNVRSDRGKSPISTKTWIPEKSSDGSIHLVMVRSFVPPDETRQVDSNGE